MKNKNKNLKENERKKITNQKEEETKDVINGKKLKRKFLKNEESRSKELIHKWKISFMALNRSSLNNSKLSKIYFFQISIFLVGEISFVRILMRCKGF